MQRIAAFLALLVVLGACPQPMPHLGDPVAHVVDCTRRSFTSQMIGLIPAINTCLVSLVTLSPTACLLALVDPARNIGEDDLACIVRSRGAEYAAAARERSGDEVSGRAAQAASQFLNERRILFAD